MQRKQSKRREQNVGAVERGISIVGEDSGSLSGLVLLVTGPGSFLLGLALVALMLLDIDFFVIGVTGYRPLYHGLGLSTAQPKPRPA